jgi:hypothetical protein
LWSDLARDRFEQVELLLHELAMASAMGGEDGLHAVCIVLWPEFESL